MSEYKNILVFCEQREDKLGETGLELVSEACILAKDLDCKVIGLLVGKDVAGLCGEIGGYGADEVIVCEHPLLEEYTTDAYAKVLCDVSNKIKPEIVLVGATNIGRDLAPRCAARLHTGLTADCTALYVDTKKYLGFLAENSNLDTNPEKFDLEDKNLKMTRPAFGGHLMATIICPRFRPQMSTVRPGVMKKAEFSQASADSVSVTKFDVDLKDEEMRTKVVEVVKETKAMVDLTGADVIVSLGYGISKDPSLAIDLANQLATSLGGVVGCSRAVVDAGLMSADHQVGQTGKTVHPKIYIALGISGAIQHKSGMQNSEMIIAVNTSENAPIFECANYGICGDLFKVLPAMIEEARK